MTFFSYLEQLSVNNRREWFEQNRLAYEKAKREVEALVQNCILSLDNLMDLSRCEAKKCLFRIHRDVRFSKNKDPYKTNFAALIGPDGKKSKDVVAVYLHFQPGASFLAAGLYEPDKDQLAKIRQEIDYNGTKFREILNQQDFMAAFGGMKGSQLKTIPKGYSTENSEADLLRFTQFYVMHSFSDAEVYAPDFPQNVRKHAELVQPFLGFLEEAMQ